MTPIEEAKARPREQAVPNILEALARSAKKCTDDIEKDLQATFAQEQGKEGHQATQGARGVKTDGER